MWISHRKEIPKLTFRALAIRWSDARNVSFGISLRWLIHIINPVDKTQLSQKRCLSSHWWVNINMNTEIKTPAYKLMGLWQITDKKQIIELSIPLPPGYKTPYGFS